MATVLPKNLDVKQEGFDAVIHCNINKMDVLPPSLPGSSYLFYLSKHLGHRGREEVLFMRRNHLLLFRPATGSFMSMYGQKIKSVSVYSHQK